MLPHPESRSEHTQLNWSVATEVVTAPCKHTIRKAAQPRVIAVNEEAFSDTGVMGDASWTVERPVRLSSAVQLTAKAPRVRVEAF